MYLESPTNPTLQVSDIEAIADYTDEAILAVDNTFASPALQRPLSLDADVVVESRTKYISGHSDAIAGPIVTDGELLKETIEFIQYNQGATLGLFEAFLVQRCSKTIGGRIWTHCENARIIAEYLESHQAIESVYYSGLESHPDHEIATGKMTYSGGMVSVELDATLEQTSDVLSAMEVFQLAGSLGGVETPVEQPAVMTHQDLSPEERREAGISDSFIRLSVGIEDAEDLIDDLETAIADGLEKG
ncbi:Cystathionine beta-lyase/cystathionine gamma-synthase (plasmid) [Halalkaliarchaeum sp. AArc-CO]|nr:Cystathionine beta-lyase/cystathionine gamma-synthase [Halalkaliarchaeum sp. AArc-CO]